MITIDELQMEPGAEYDFAITDDTTITNFSVGEWSGIPGDLTIFNSEDAQTQATIIAPASVEVSYSRWANVKNTGDRIIANDGTSIDEQNNEGVQFHIEVTRAIYNPGKPVSIYGNSFLTTRGSGKIELSEGNGVWIEVLEYFSWSNKYLTFKGPTNTGVYDLKITNDYGEELILPQSIISLRTIPIYSTGRSIGLSGAIQDFVFD
jgi:hypothetical protein